MKSNKGITLTALIIYVICIVFVTGLVSSLASYFYSNSSEIIVKNNSHEQYTKLLTYIAKDINNSDLEDCEADGNELIFYFSGEKQHKYILENGIIYYQNTDEKNLKKIVLCENVSRLINTKAFLYENSQLFIRVEINGEEFSNTFTIKFGNLM